MVVLHLVYHQIQLLYIMMMHIIEFIFVEFACKLCIDRIIYCMYCIALILKDNEISSMDVNDINLERNIFILTCNINTISRSVLFIFENVNKSIALDLNITAYLEINPLVVMRDLSGIYILDLTAKLDSCAEYIMHTEWSDIITELLGVHYINKVVYHLLVVVVVYRMNYQIL